jgi:MoxR-like ATPase
MATTQISLATVNHTELMSLMGHVLSLGHSLMIRGGVGIGKTHTVEEYARKQAKDKGRKFLNWKRIPKEERMLLAHGKKVVHYVMNDEGDVVLYKKVEDENGEEKEKVVGSIDLQQYEEDLKNGNEKLLEGAPKIAEQYSRKDVYIFAVFDTLNKLPEDTAGIPVPVNGFIEWKPPVLFYTLAQPGAAGLLFLDEFMQAQQSVQKPLADLFLNKQISDMFLQDEVSICAASNEDHDKCGTIRLLEHMKNRMGHCILMPPSAEEWCKWAQAAGIDARIIMMIRSQPDMLYMPVGNRKEDAFPSPRAWHILSDCIKDINEQTQKTLFLRIVATRVGSGAAARFKAVLDHDMSKVGPEILNDPDKFSGAAWDRKVAFTIWMSGHSKGDAKFLDKACEFMNAVQGNDMLDTMIYMMRTQVGKPFLVKVSGTTKYQGLRDQLIDISKAFGGAA